MKLITLNIWGGHVYKPLMDFIINQRDTDIFCFQEVYHKAPARVSTEDRQVSLNLFSELSEILPEHTGYFRPAVNDIYGICAFVRNNVEVVREGEITVYDNPDYAGAGPAHSRNLQWLECRVDGQAYSVMNLHGLWNGKGKTDNPERLSQSSRIRQFMDSVTLPKVLCGDFNLKPDTESLKMLEQGMDNLVKKFNITSTRTSYYPKVERFADYILVSPEISVNRFEVLKDEVSDHSPLLLEFN